MQRLLLSLSYQAATKQWWRPASLEHSSWWVCLNLWWPLHLYAILKYSDKCIYYVFIIFLTNTQICSFSKWLSVTFKCSPAFISRKSVWKYLSFFDASFPMKILLNYVSADICYSKYAYCSHVRTTRRKRLGYILFCDITNSALACRKQW